MPDSEGGWTQMAAGVSWMSKFETIKFNDLNAKALLLCYIAVCITHTYYQPKQKSNLGPESKSTKVYGRGLQPTAHVLGLHHAIHPLCNTSLSLPGVNSALSH